MGYMVIMHCSLHYLLKKEEAMRLKEIRTERGLSVPKLVELSGVPRRTIQEIENRNDCRVSTAIQLADALGVTLDELCRDEVAK
jgi:predicted transcriptional regulator